ncbi:MAG: TlpA family protein disulfide reductase [Labedaea sp.]
MRRVGPLAVLGVLLALAGCATGKDAVSAGSDFQFVSPGGKTDIRYEGADRKTAGELAGESLLEADKQVRLSDYAGQVVVLNIWGSWCGPCRVEAPELQKLYDQTRGSGVTVLGVDVHDEQRSAPADFVRDRAISYPSIYDPPARTLLALRGYPRSTVPSTIIFDREHRVAAVYLRDLRADDLLPVVNRLAAES